MLTVGQNSWATVAEADAYLTDRIQTIEWFELDEQDAPGEVSKETLLISAFYWLKNAPQLSLSENLTDGVVKNAQIEAAWFLYEHYTSLNARRAAIFTGVEEFELSKRTERLRIGNLQIPDFILGSLSAYAVENTVITLKGHYDA